MEEGILFGYCINDVVLIDISRQRIFRLDGRSSKIPCVPVRDTMMRLLLYMLTSTQGHILTNNEILLHVWDRHQLSSSSQRLWQVMKALKKKLDALGVPDEFIMRIEPHGYYVNQSIVSPLYLRRNSINTELFQGSGSEI
ncbi:winged helix-turn-helix domain-containing protein [Dryocola clanedunensis]